MAEGGEPRAPACGGSVRFAPWFASALVLAACSKSDDSKSSGAGGAVTPSAAVPAPAAGAGACPATGLWAECSILYRLERSGLAPQIDSTAKPAEASLAGKPLIVK